MVRRVPKGPRTRPIVRLRTRSCNVPRRRMTTLADIAPKSIRTAWHPPCSGHHVPVADLTDCRRSANPSGRVRRGLIDHRGHPHRTADLRTRTAHRIRRLGRARRIRLRMALQRRRHGTRRAADRARLRRAGQYTITTSCHGPNGEAAVCSFTTITVSSDRSRTRRTKSSTRDDALPRSVPVPARFTPGDVGLHFPSSREILWDPRDGSRASQYTAMVRAATQYLVVMPDVMRVMRDIPSCQTSMERVGMLAGDASPARPRRGTRAGGSA